VEKRDDHPRASAKKVLRKEETQYSQGGPPSTNWIQVGLKGEKECRASYASRCLLSDIVKELVSENYYGWEPCREKTRSRACGQKKRRPREEDRRPKLATVAPDK